MIPNGFNSTTVVRADIYISNRVGLKEGDIVVNDVRLRVLGNREQYDKDGNKEEWKIERDEK